MSDITADVTETTIAVSVNGGTISATVDGGTISTTVGAGQGPQGPPGPSGAATWDDIANKPSTFTPSAHAATHQLGGGDDLEVSTFQISMDPTGFSIITDGGLQDALYSLDQAIVGRALVSHVHAAGDITSGTVAPARLGSGTASASTYLRGDSTWQTISATYTLPAATGSVLGGVKIGSGLSIDGSGVLSATYSYTLPAATTSTLGGVIVGAGLSVSSGTVSANVTSVAGRTGAVTLTKADVGLQNVDNTSDANKPISTATQTALDGKAAASHATQHFVDGSDPIEITGDQVLVSVEWDNFTPAYPTVMEVLYEVDQALNGKANTNHSHGQILDTGAIGGTANLPLITTTGGVITVGSFGSSANTFCAGNDARLSDSRTPTSHTHGNITNGGAIGSTTDKVVVTGASGVLTTVTVGSGLTLSGGTLTASGGGGGSSVGSDLYLWSTYR